MKTIIHKNHSRGHANQGWLDSYHTFSFAEYYNPERMNFGNLRVLNDDVVEPGRGFDTHPHQNMEIVSIPLAGKLSHKDSMGNEHIIPAGDIQIMSAGTGVTHSEYNHSKDEKTNFLQIWIIPQIKNTEPSYAQKSFFEENRINKFQLIVSPNGDEGSLPIKQDAYFSLLDLEEGKSNKYHLNNPDHGIYIFVMKGEVSIDDQHIMTRDGMGITEASEIEIQSHLKSKLLLIEVKMD